jgi:hypothetical protein
MSERVLQIWIYHDGPRTGLALFNGLPHYFECIFDEDIDEFSDIFELYPVGDEFLELTKEQDKIFREWESRFHKGLASRETNPDHRGVNPKYDELDDLLDNAVAKLKPLANRYVPKFEALPDLAHPSPGIAPEPKASWVPVGQ